MIKKIREALNGALVQAFRKSLYTVGLAAIGLFLISAVLNALFWSVKVFGFLLGITVGWATYINYVYGVPKVETLRREVRKW